MSTFDLFVGNFPQNAAGESDKILRAMFGKFGTIVSTEMREGTRNDGTYIGFVRYASAEARDKALSEAKKSPFTISGLKLFVRPPRSKAELPSGNMKSYGDVKQKNVSFSCPIVKPASAGDCIPEAVGELNLLVTHVESVCHLWAQVASPENARQLTDVNNGITGTRLPTVTGRLQPGQIYGAQFTDDLNWYRCVLLRHISEDKSEVQYVDYGNTDIIVDTSAVSLSPQLANLEPFAKRYWLFPYKPADKSITELQEGVNTLQMLQDQIIKCEIYPSSPMFQNTTPIVARTNDVPVGGTMEDKGFVVPLSREELLNVYPSFKNTATGRPLKAGGTESSGTLSRLNPPPPQSPQPRPLQRQILAAGDGAVSSAEIQQLTANNIQLRMELSQKQEEHRKTCKEAEASMLEFKKKYQDLEQKCFLFEEKCNVLLHDTFSRKLERLLASLSTVSQLRLRFPTDMSVRDGIEMAAALVVDGDSRLLVSKMATLGHIKECEQAYRNYQDSICQLRTSQDTSTLDELITLRNQARVAFFESLVEFLSVAHDLPLSAKAKQIESALCALRKNYVEYMGTAVDVSQSSLQDILDQYNRWKASKTAMFLEIRGFTDVYRQKIISAFKLLQHRFVDIDTDSSSTPDVDALLEECQLAVEQELSKIHEAQSTEDILVISQAVQILISELDLELDNIRQIQQLQSDYSELSVSLQRWLEDRPDVDDILSTVRNIKALKSKLRHRLVDKLDLQEGDSSNDDEMNKICHDIVSIQQQLHAEFAVEDELLGNLSELAVEHFPELVLQYPDLQLTNYIDYRGLVKLGRSLDQFDLCPLPGVNKTSIHHAAVCNKSVVIKEFIIGESVGVTREVFLSNLMSYHSVANSGYSVLPVQAVFFEQRDTIAAVQLPRLRSLTESVASSPGTETGIYLMLSGALHGLHALHQAKIVHGAVHPNNILLSETTAGILADYDFKKTLLQRAQKVFTSSSGLRFVCPEVESDSSSVTEASDMFNFGLLILWVFYPHRMFTFTKHNVPCITDVDLPNGLMAVVKSLLHPAAGLRPTAAQLLQHEYFSSLRCVNHTPIVNSGAESEVSVEPQSNISADPKPSDDSELLTSDSDADLAAAAAAVDDVAEPCDLTSITQQLGHLINDQL